MRTIFFGALAALLRGAFLVVPNLLVKRRKIRGIEAGFSGIRIRGLFPIQFLNIFIIFIIFDLEIFLLFGVIFLHWTRGRLLILIFIGATLWVEWTGGALNWDLWV